ncbi:MAG TPA: cytochrome c3 family protein [Gemmatimonadota bacterium]|nr:cytochrome c3 family protein [Gemmatimonadota bacterium]
MDLLRRGAAPGGAAVRAGAVRAAAAAVPLAFLLLVGGARSVSAQLISPGKLAAAHAELEGVRNCTKCHELGQRGISDAKCLACHTPLRTRIEAKEGWHATVADRGCASCHKDHLGRDADLERLDRSTFDHAATGFRLEGRHAGVECRDCHRPGLVRDADVREFKSRHGALARTWLGLGTTCEGCHRDDDPHGGQFAGRSCTDCHGQETWKEVPAFDHAATRYPLTGAHRSVGCGRCHRTVRAAGGTRVRYAGISFAVCTSCHRDPHGGSMGSTCTRCHTTAGWDRMDRSAVERGFDHSTTGFSLEGRHAEISCASCHQRGSESDSTIHLTFRPGAERHPFPPPVATSCASCHLDAHHGAFAARGDGGACTACHGQEAWKPTTFDLFRHDEETDFRLAGAHAAVPCEGCHRNPALGQTELTFRFASTSCRSCHENTDDPHHGQFGDASCESCHTTSSFASADGFDHARTRFPLTGAHRDVPCASCHRKERLPDGSEIVRYRPLGTECRDCHAHRGDP